MQLPDRQLEDTSIGEFNAKKAKFNTDDVGFLMEALSSNLYSNPIGSFIRELATNGVDANIKAGVTNPVLVEFYIDYESESDACYVSFTDQGAGMSVKDFDEIYNVWGSSDKRKTNEQHGGWGLGSKSPLAYRESFEIYTTYNGEIRHYIYRKTEDVPESILLSTKPTDEPNGTKVIIEIDREDYSKVSYELRHQLAYFDHVFVKDWYMTYHNDFKIFHKELYTYRTKNVYNEMHIILGQVPYRIDWDILELDPIDIPIALRFPVGSLEVNLSREDIKYNKKEKQLITERYNQVVEEFKQSCEDQLEAKDFKTYMYYKTKKKRPDVYLDFETFRVRFNEKISYKDVFFKVNGKKFKRRLNTECLFPHYIIYDIDKKGKHTQVKMEVYDLLRNDNLFYVKDKFNYYDSLYLAEKRLLKRGKLNKKKLYTLANAFGCLNVLYKTKEGKVVNNYETGYETLYIISSEFTQIYASIKPYLDEMIARVHIYEGVAPKEWIEDLKEADRQKKELTKGSITYYSKNRVRTQVLLKDYLESADIIYYLDYNVDTIDMLHYLELFKLCKESFKKENDMSQKTRDKKAFRSKEKEPFKKIRFCYTSPTVIKKLKKFDHCLPIQDIFKEPIFYHTIKRIKISHNVTETIKSYGEYVDKVLPDYYKVANKIGDLCLDYAFARNNIRTKGGITSDFRINLYYFFENEINHIWNTTRRMKIRVNNQIQFVTEAYKELKMAVPVIEMYNYINWYSMPVRVQKNHKDIVKKSILRRKKSKYLK